MAHYKLSKLFFPSRKAANLLPFLDNGVPKLTEKWKKLFIAFARLPRQDKRKQCIFRRNILFGSCRRVSCYIQVPRPKLNHSQQQSLLYFPFFGCARFRDLWQFVIKVRSGGGGGSHVNQGGRTLAHSLARYWPLSQPLNPFPIFLSAKRDGRLLLWWDTQLDSIKIASAGTVCQGFDFSTRNHLARRHTSKQTDACRQSGMFFSFLYGKMSVYLYYTYT